MKEDFKISELANLDRVIHEPARLMLMILLYVVSSADFTFLMSETGLSWGNLSSHMTKLEEAGYIEVEKEFVNKKPKTLLKLTGKGRKAFNRYSEAMSAILGTA
jgi:DNA-binding MarR family transcriptional regulator